MLCQFTQTILRICLGDYLKYPCCFPHFAYPSLAYVTDKLEVLAPFVENRQKHKDKRFCGTGGTITTQK